MINGIFLVICDTEYLIPHSHFWLEDSVRGFRVRLPRLVEDHGPVVSYVGAHVEREWYSSMG